MKAILILKTKMTIWEMIKRRLMTMKRKIIMEKNKMRQTIVIPLTTLRENVGKELKRESEHKCLPEGKRSLKLTTL